MLGGGWIMASIKWVDSLMLKNSFFERDPIVVAKALLGKVIKVRFKNIWLKASIIETEAYFLSDKASHASLGFTEKRKALFMSGGTIYMYYARGGDSLNISCQGEGNAVLIKSGIPFVETAEDEKMVRAMKSLNPLRNRKEPRETKFLCSGQTLLCKSLSLKVIHWDQKNFDSEKFFMEDIGYSPQKIVQAARLGIPKGRDEHLLYRFIDYDYAPYCTDNPLKKRKWTLGKEYFILNGEQHA